MFFKFCMVFWSKLLAFLFLSILFISFTIISSVLTFLVIYLLRFLRFLGFSNQSCFFYLFCRFFSSLLRFVTLLCYLGFSDQSYLLLSFVPILFISFIIISPMFIMFLVFYNTFFAFSRVLWSKLLVFIFYVYFLHLFYHYFSGVDIF